MQNQEVKVDGADNSYIDVHNVRLSLVEKTGEGTSRYLRFSAYTADGRGVMHGPELLLNDENVLNLLRAVMTLVQSSEQHRQARAA